jgi:hypothetical protein
MADVRSGSPRTGSVRIVRLSIAPHPQGPDAVPLTIVAQLDPAPGWEELPWWRGQLRDLLNVRWGGSSTGVTTIQVDAAEAELEEVARQLLAAVDEANALYPERYAVWRREHDAQVAEERQRQERRSAARQAILDRVMNERKPLG